MKQKTVALDCDHTTAQHIAEAIRAYAHSAFPPGGSDCAQVSREALLDSASICASHESGTLVLRKRQMPQIRAAVNWYFGEEGPGESGKGIALTALLARRNPAA